MKFTAVLLAIILFIGAAASMKVVTSEYANEDCSGPVVSTESYDVKSGTCFAPDGDEDGVKISRKGKEIEVCNYSGPNCSGSEICMKTSDSMCISGSEFKVLGSASSVAFSGLFIVVAAVLAIAF